MSESNERLNFLKVAIGTHCVVPAAPSLGRISLLHRSSLGFVRCSLFVFVVRLLTFFILLNKILFPKGISRFLKLNYSVRAERSQQLVFSKKLGFWVFTKKKTDHGPRTVTNVCGDVGGAGVSIQLIIN